MKNLVSLLTSMPKIKIFAIGLFALFLSGCSSTNIGDRVDNVWQIATGGNYIKTTAISGYGLLINGTSKYLNFGTSYGSSGYGFRDNSGVMEFKSSGGGWIPIAAGGSGGAMEGFGTSTDGYSVFLDNNNLFRRLGVNDMTPDFALEVGSSSKLGYFGIGSDGSYLLVNGDGRTNISELFSASSTFTNINGVAASSYQLNNGDFFGTWDGLATTSFLAINSNFLGTWDGYATNTLPYLSTTLNSGLIFIGNASNQAEASTTASLGIPTSASTTAWQNTRLAYASSSSWFYPLRASSSAYQLTRLAYASTSPLFYSLRASSSQFDTFYESPFSRITAGAGLTWTGNTLSVSGVGDVVGPASAISGNLAVFDGTTGKLIRDSRFATSSFFSAYGDFHGTWDGLTTTTLPYIGSAARTAYSFLITDASGVVQDLAVSTNSIVGRINGVLVNVPIDSDLTSTSAGDDTVPSAKATKTYADTKTTLGAFSATYPLTYSGSGVYAYKDITGTASTSISSTSASYTKLVTEGAVKDYADNLAQGEFDYYFTDHASRFTGYYVMDDTITGEGKSTISSSTTATGQKIISFISSSTAVVPAQFSEGTYSVHAHFAKTAGTKTARVYAEIYASSSAGMDLLVTTEQSNVLTSATTSDTIHGFLDNDVTVSGRTTVVVIIKSVVSGGGTNPTIAISMENLLDSGLSLPASTNIFKSIFVAYDSATSTGWQSFRLDPFSRLWGTAGQSIFANVIGQFEATSTIVLSNQGNPTCSYLNASELVSASSTITSLNSVSMATFSATTTDNWNTRKAYYDTVELIPTAATSSAWETRSRSWYNWLMSTSTKADNVIDTIGTSTGMCWNIASSSMQASSTLLIADKPLEFYKASCKVNSGTSIVGYFSSAGGNMASMTCGTSLTNYSLPSNNAVAEEGDLTLEYGTNTGSADKLTVCIYRQVK